MERGNGGVEPARLEFKPELVRYPEKTSEKPKKNRPEPEAVSGKDRRVYNDIMRIHAATHEMKYAVQGIGGEYENS